MPKTPYPVIRCLSALVPILLTFASASQASEPLHPSLPGQLPTVMHVPMTISARVVVGPENADIIGNDNVALQAAMDYLAGLGGGVLEIRPGEYTMRDSLHLRDNVTVQGTHGRSILKKADGQVSKLILDGDFGEEQITVANPEGFRVGAGVAVWDKNAGGFHTTVARITGQVSNTFAISMPLNADCMVDNGAQAATVYPVISGYNVRGAVVQDITIEGNKENNISLNGCRGGGIFLFRSHGTLLQRCTVRHYNGDGISFQQCNDVRVVDCVSEGNTGLGLHPGSGSQRPVISHCVARGNAEDGLFLCWRVKHGTFENNVLEGNGRFGISIGHKDTDNLLKANTVRGNSQAGVFFRNESEGMAGHRNLLEANVIENNGTSDPAPGIRVRGNTTDLIFKDNVIRDTRRGAERKQTTGILLEEKVGRVTLDNNQIEASIPLKDNRSAQQ